MDQGLRSLFERGGPDMPNFDVLFPGISYLLPIAVLCGFSLLLTLLWLLAVWKHLCGGDAHPSEPPEGWETDHERPTASDRTGHLGANLRWDTRLL